MTPAKGRSTKEGKSGGHRVVCRKSKPQTEWASEERGMVGFQWAWTRIRIGVWAWVLLSGLGTGPMIIANAVAEEAHSHANRIPEI